MKTLLVLILAGVSASVFGQATNTNAAPKGIPVEQYIDMQVSRLTAEIKALQDRQKKLIEWDMAQRAASGRQARVSRVEPQLKVLRDTITLKGRQIAGYKAQKLQLELRKPIRVQSQTNSGRKVKLTPRR